MFNSGLLVKTVTDYINDTHCLKMKYNGESFDMGEYLNFIAEVDDEIGKYLITVRDKWSDEILEQVIAKGWDGLMNSLVCYEDVYINLYEITDEDEVIEIGKNLEIV